MEPYELMQDIREQLGDSTIVDELIQYMSTDELNEFTNHLIKMFDIDYIEESIKYKRHKKLNENKRIDNKFKKYLELFDEYDMDLIPCEDFDIHTADGQLITHIGLTEAGDILLFNGNPDEDKYWDEIVVSNNEKLEILEEIYNLYF